MDAPDQFEQAIHALRKSGDDAFKVIEQKFMQMSAEMERASESVRQARIQWQQAGGLILSEYKKLKGNNNG